MGYVDKILGDNERVIYSTHQHLIVVLQRSLGWLLVFAIFLGLGLTFLLSPENLTGEKVRWWIGFATLISALFPIYLIVSAWLRGHRGAELVRRIWLPVTAGILILVVAALAMSRPSWRPTGWVGVVLAAIPLAQLTYIYLDWINERYLITSRRVMELKGIINKHARDSALEKVNDVDLKQSVFGRLLGYGTLQIITGSDIGVNILHRISNPVRFKRTMLNAKEQLHLAVPGMDGDGYTLAVSADQAGDARVDLPATPSPADIPDLIEELDELRQRGIISDREFRAKKRDLLSRM